MTDVRNAVDQVRSAAPATEKETEVALSVIVPVFNQESSIAANLATIRDSVREGLGERFELIVVSDGSIDETAERVLEEHSDTVRVIHYDRNMGKGYAVKIGALEARGRYVAYIDADLDLHPDSLAEYVHRLEAAGLDFAIGSKRHPQSQVDYPPSRRVASWLYQQLVRALFRLDVRDTQVGLKVFRREIAEEVLPLLLVKRYAFDLELLAVSRALGYGRIEEQPVRLDYRFAGSGVRSLAVLHALVDTAAIFYRLRVLRYYQRKQALVGRHGWTRPRDYAPLVSVVTTNEEAAAAVSYPRVEVVLVEELAPASVWSAAQGARGDVLAVLEESARPASNWLSATTPFLARGEIDAVVVPKVTPHTGDRLERAAAAVGESRMAGSQYFHFTPGNLRYVNDYAGGSVVLSRERLLGLGAPPPLDEVAARLVDAGGTVLYTPETVLTERPPRLFRPAMRATLARGRRRARELRRRGRRAMRLTTLVPIVLILAFAAGPVALLAGGAVRTLWLGGAVTYVVLTVAAAAVAGVKFRSPLVGLLAAGGIVAAHAAYGVGLLAGLLRG